MGRLIFTTRDGEMHSLGKAHRGEWTEFESIWKSTLHEAIRISKLSGKDVFYCLKRFGAGGIYNYVI